MLVVPTRFDVSPPIEISSLGLAVGYRTVDRSEVPVSKIGIRFAGGATILRCFS